MQYNQKTHEQFLKELSEKNTKFKEGKLKILGVYKTDKTPLRVKDEFGILITTPGSLLQNHTPGILSAIDKTAYFKEEAIIKNEKYRGGEFKIIGEYRVEDKYIRVEDEYGILNVAKGSIIQGNGVTINSAIDKNKYLHNMLLKYNLGYKDGNFKIIGDYKGNKTPIKLETEFGVCKMTSVSLLLNQSPSIKSAVNKTMYAINQFKKIHGEGRYIYDKFTYSTPFKKEYIYCTVHNKYFKQNYDSHKSGGGCHLCADESRRKHKQKNPVGWTVTSWYNAALRSKRYDSFKVYIIKLKEKDGTIFYKIGRTFSVLDIRMEEIKARFTAFETLKTIELKEITIENATIIFNLETILKRVHRDFKHLPSVSFGGMHECFTQINIDEVLTKVKELGLEIK